MRDRPHPARRGVRERRAAADHALTLNPVDQIFDGLGGEAGRGLPELLRETGIKAPEIDAHVVALEPGHPYLRMPLQFATALEKRLLGLVNASELERLRHECEVELQEPDRWGTTFTLLQCWGRVK